MLWAVPATVRRLDHFWCTAWVSTSNGSLALLWFSVSSEPFWPSQLSSFTAAAALAPGWTHIMKQVDLSRCLSQAKWDVYLTLECIPGWSWETNFHPLQFLSILSTQFQKQASMCALSWSRNQASHSSPPTARRTCLLAIKHHFWGVQYATSADHSGGGISTCVTFLFFWVPYQGQRS